ncbi:hypothetical protein [Pontibacter liquoris]|uniref:hypothetical protein n=1 Tax=Pontibacter liquoris TaxID=2905677 RepID=UPI001FA6F0EA|nr:hypothetical protein [Pontibacter liquoris]
MEDFKIILYILLGVAYLIFTKWLKAFKGPDDAHLPEDTRYTSKGKPLQPPRPATSLEDMLRELQPKAQKPLAKGEVLVQSAKEKVRQELTPRPQPVVINYEEMPVRELSWEKPAEARQVLRQSQQRRQVAFNAYDKVQAKQQPYKELLRNPTTAKDAFILSEIFKRKYE